MTTSQSTGDQPPWREKMPKSPMRVSPSPISSCTIEARARMTRPCYLRYLPVFHQIQREIHEDTGSRAAWVQLMRGSTLNTSTRTLSFWRGFSSWSISLHRRSSIKTSLTITMSIRKENSFRIRWTSHLLRTRWRSFRDTRISISWTGLKNGGTFSNLWGLHQNLDKHQACSQTNSWIRHSSSSNNSSNWFKYHLVLRQHPQGQSRPSMQERGIWASRIRQGSLKPIRLLFRWLMRPLTAPKPL